MGGNIHGSRITVNVPQVIHESIDGEVIIIDLSTGTYYSLKDTAAEAWELIQRPAGIDGATMIEVFERRYGVPRSELEASLGGFLKDLTDEGLVVHAEGPGNRVGDTHQSMNGEVSHFTAPVIEKFTDMQDLVLLDPVHEVHEMGWPQARTDLADAGAGG